MLPSVHEIEPMSLLGKSQYDIGSAIAAVGSSASAPGSPPHSTASRSLGGAKSHDRSEENKKTARSFLKTWLEGLVGSKEQVFKDSTSLDSQYVIISVRLPLTQAMYPPL